MALEEVGERGEPMAYFDVFRRELVQGDEIIQGECVMVKCVNRD
jgi:hypothetical protein